MYNTNRFVYLLITMFSITAIYAKRPFVLIDGARAHPTRVLATLKNNIPQPRVTVREATNYRVNHEYKLVPGLVSLDLDVENNALNAVDPVAGGEILKKRITALRESGLFDLIEPDYIQSANLRPSDAAFTDGTLWGLNNFGQLGGVQGADINVIDAWDFGTG